MIFDLGDRREGDFDYLSVRAFHLYAWSSECLSGFHAANNAPHSLAVNRYNLDITFTVQGLQRRECLCDFHVTIPPKFTVA